MLANKQTRVIPGIKDARWSTIDKMDQYRGILKLHDREKKLGSRDAAKAKKRISRRLISFREDVKRYRRIANDPTGGFATDLARGALRDRQDLRFKCYRRGAEHLYDSVYEESHRKRRRLDELRYEKKRKMKRCFELQLEHARLFDDYTREQEIPWTQDQTQQQLITSYQQSIAKRNAAKAINITYASMLEILRKDAVRHDALLNALKEDRRSQCEVMLEVTMMGQLAVERSDDIGEECKRVSRKLWSNMKEREQALTFVRGRVEEVWSFARSLIRTESETAFAVEITRAPTASNATLEKQIRSLERVFDRVQESLLVRSYRELLVRLEEQTKQRARLLERFERNVKERDLLLSKKNEALSTLSDVERSFVAAAEEYNTDKNVLLEQIAMQKKKELEHENSRRDCGKLLMDIRAALQNMVAMLICVRRGGKMVKQLTRDTDRRLRREDKEEKDDADEHEEVITRIDVPIIQVEREGLALLSTVSRKVGALFGMSNFDFDEDREERAKDLYRTYVSDYRSRLKFADLELEPTGLVVEHEVIDSSVPTRADIKLKSKQAVEAYTRLE